MTSTYDILAALTDAVAAGAAEIIRVKRSGNLGVAYKDATELVTTADQASDTAMRLVLEPRLAGIDSEISIYLEESGGGAVGMKEVGGDPLDGTNIFACGGTAYSIQAHYAEKGVPLAGVVFQPELFLPLEESPSCLGRIVTAVCGQGAFARRSEYCETGFHFGEPRPVRKRTLPATKRFVACVPVSARMHTEERERVRRVMESGLIALTTGAGNAGANALMTIFGGQHVYANFGAGQDLGLIPPQVIAEEAGITVWGADRTPPRWLVRKQPVIFAPDPATAERFFQAAGY